MKSYVQSRTTSLVVGCLLLFSSHSTHAQENDAAKAPATISGVVRWVEDVPVNTTAAHLHRWDSDRQRWRTSEQSISVGSDGAFQFEGLPGDEYWCVGVRAPEAGIVFRQFVAESGKNKPVNINLRPASAAYITVRNDQGQPLAGAKFRSMELVDGTEGSFSIRRGSEEGLDIPVAVSDENGRLSLAAFSKGIIFKSGWIDHPDFAAITISPDAILQSGEIAAVQLSRGFPVHFDIRAAMSSTFPAIPAEVTVNLRHNQIFNAASVLGVPFPTSNRGFGIQLEPGQYQLLRLSSTSHVFLPIVSLDTSSRIRIGPGENDRWIFRALPKVLMRGRVITAGGKPVPKAILTGDIKNFRKTARWHRPNGEPGQTSVGDRRIPKVNMKSTWLRGAVGFPMRETEYHRSIILPSQLKI